jgi:hypothetical protein
MTCKCGHLALDHPYTVVRLHGRKVPRYPCTKCYCINYDMAPIKEAGF